MTRIYTDGDFTKHRQAEEAARGWSCGIVSHNASGVLLQTVSAYLKEYNVGVEWLKTPLPEKPVPYQLLLLREKCPDVVSWAKRQQQCGVVVVPDPRTIEIVKDRRMCRELLSRAGVRTPEAVYGTPAELLTLSLEHLFPLVLKQRQVHSLLVRVINTPRQLANKLRSYDVQTELVAERYIVGRHLTAYFIGTWIFVFAKLPLLGDYGETQRVLSPSSTIVECVNRYRTATRLGFGKVDIVESAFAGAYCVDGGIFPKFRNIPEAGMLLAGHLLTYMGHRQPIEFGT